MHIKSVINVLRTFAPKIFPRSDFFQTFAARKAKTIGGVTMLASEIKRIGNVVLLESLIWLYKAKSAFLLQGIN